MDDAFTKADVFIFVGSVVAAYAVFRVILWAAGKWGGGYTK